MLSIKTAISIAICVRAPAEKLTMVRLNPPAPLIKLREIITTWKYDQGDGIAELITLLGVLALGIEEGIALGVIITILSYLRRTSRPHIAVVGRIKAGSYDFT
jgi:SulP family sulfate permease